MPVYTLSEYLSASFLQDNIIAEGVLPLRSRMIVGALPRVGKTTMLTQLALEIASGSPALGLFDIPRPRRVIMMQQEIGDEAFQQRLSSAAKGYRNLSLDNLFIYPCAGLKFDTPAGNKEIELLLAEIEPDVIVLDPLYKFWCVSDENAAAEVQRREDILDRYISTFGVSIIIAHHLKKPNRDVSGRFVRQESSLDLRGSSQLVAWADTVLVLSPVEKDKLVGTLDMRHAKDEPPVLILNRDRANMRFNAEMQGDPTGPVEQSVVKVLQSAGNHMAYKDIMKVITSGGSSRRTCQAALSRLRTKGLITYTGMGTEPRSIWLVNPRTVGWHLFE